MGRDYTFEYSIIEVFDKEGRIRCRASLLDESVWSPESLDCWANADFVLDRMPGDDKDRCFVEPVRRYDYRQEADGTTTQIESWDNGPYRECKIERRMNSLGQVISELDGPAIKVFEYDPSGRVIRETVRNCEGAIVSDSTYGYRQAQIVSSGVPMRAEVTDIQRKRADGTVSVRTLITAYLLSDKMAWKREEEKTPDGSRSILITEYTYWGENFEFEWEERYDGCGDSCGYGMRRYSKVLEVDD